MSKILLVDDEENLLELLELVLEEKGHRIFTATNGLEALKIIEREKPDLVISDVMMPVMDGNELLKRVRSNPDWADIKIVLISAGFIRRDSNFLANQYINKPYDLETIETLVGQFAENNSL